MKVLALDDELGAIKILTSFAGRTQLISDFKGFTSSIAAKEFIENQEVDLVLLDIQMPSIHGFEFAQLIPRQTQIIFTTAFHQYAVEAFDIRATDYLLKPIQFSRFEKAIERAFEIYTQKTNLTQQKLTIKQDYGFTNINMDAILFFEAQDDYVKIFFENGKTKLVRSTMKAMISKLPENKFIRIHKSYIVSIANIECVRAKKITIHNLELPIGSSYYTVVKQLFN
jgi:DNA-binding LytR/AlgR family response regulator